jgi:hypothetical protein
VKDMLLNVGSGGGAAAAPAAGGASAPSGGAGGAAEAAPEEKKEEGMDAPRRGSQNELLILHYREGGVRRGYGFWTVRLNAYKDSALFVRLARFQARGRKIPCKIDRPDTITLRVLEWDTLMIF